MCVCVCARARVPVCARVHAYVFFQKYSSLHGLLYPSKNELIIVSVSNILSIFK